MNCDNVMNDLAAASSGTLPADKQQALADHLEHCRACSDLVSGARALAYLRERPAAAAPDWLYARVHASLRSGLAATGGRDRFWLGAIVGGAVAASMVAAVVLLPAGLSPQEPPVPMATPGFEVVLGEPRAMNIAIESKRALDDARITIMLSGGIELDGYGGQRELSWTTHLESGVNRLSLPVRAITGEGGSLVVQLRHPETDQLFVVDVLPRE